MNEIPFANYSLALLIFGYFQMFMRSNFDSGKHWGTVALGILENSPKPNARSKFMAYAYLYLWFRPIEELTEKLFSLYEIGMRCGDVDSWPVLEILFLWQKEAVHIIPIVWQVHEINGMLKFKLSCLYYSAFQQHSF